MESRVEGKSSCQRKLFLFGAGIAHSQSPTLFSTVFSELGFPWFYEAVECLDAADFLHKLDATKFLAANVTMPFKRDALRASQWADEYSLKAGGANLLIPQGDIIRAYNTDGIGAALFFRKEGIYLEGASIVVCGTGVTARSIACAFERESAKVRFLSRTPKENAFEYGTKEANTVLRSADLIVHATPLGMAPGDRMPFDIGLLSSRQIVMDVVYGHGQTELGRATEQAGCRYFDGMGMLVGQASAALPLILASAGVPSGYEPGDFFDIMMQTESLRG